MYFFEFLSGVEMVWEQFLWKHTQIIFFSVYDMLFCHRFCEIHSKVHCIWIGKHIKQFSNTKTKNTWSGGVSSEWHHKGTYFSLVELAFLWQNMDREAEPGTTSCLISHAARLLGFTTMKWMPSPYWTLRKSRAQDLNTLNSTLINVFT